MHKDIEEQFLANIHVRLTIAETERLRQIATEKGVPVSALVRAKLRGEPIGEGWTIGAKQQRSR